LVDTDVSVAIVMECIFSLDFTSGRYPLSPLSSRGDLVGAGGKM
jgi:hypothetical protein